MPRTSLDEALHRKANAEMVLLSVARLPPSHPLVQLHKPRALEMLEQVRQQYPHLFPPDPEPKP